MMTEEMKMLEEQNVKLGKYMTVFPIQSLPSRNGTRTSYLVKDSSGMPLGCFWWDSQWRQYVFSPKENSIFSHDCLAELSKFCVSINKKAKK
jgi:hypothetical protein